MSLTASASTIEPSPTAQSRSAIPAASATVVTPRTLPQLTDPASKRRRVLPQQSSLERFNEKGASVLGAQLRSKQRLNQFLAMEAQASTIRHLEEAAYWRQRRENENALRRLQGIEIADIGDASSVADIQDPDLLTTSVKEYFPSDDETSRKCMSFVCTEQYIIFYYTGKCNSVVYPDPALF
jgi:uncharacterized protein YjiS (DUF1127 family)